MFDPTPPEIAQALEAASARLERFDRLHFCTETDSTNDVALSLVLAGAPAGTSVLADVQHAGRGRRGREWSSPAGAGVYLSVIVRPRGAPGSTTLITLGAGVAVARAVRSAAGLPVELKWPNDIVIGRPWRKIGGVLCEAVGNGPRFEAVVIGVGLNVCRAVHPPTVASRATSMEIELGRSIDRGPLVVELLAGLRTMMDVLDRGDGDAICLAWRELGQAGLAGARVTWRDQDVERRGRARGIDADGALLVEREGRLERLIAGEIEWEMWAT